MHDVRFFLLHIYLIYFRKSVGKKKSAFSLPYSLLQQDYHHKTVIVIKKFNYFSAAYLKKSPGVEWILFLANMYKS